MPLLVDADAEIELLSDREEEFQWCSAADCVNAHLGACVKVSSGRAKVPFRCEDGLGDPCGVYRTNLLSHRLLD